MIAKLITLMVQRILFFISHKTIVAKCKKAGELILGERERNIRHQDPVLKKLADDKQKTKRDNVAKNQEIRKQKCQELRTIKKEMKKCIKGNEENQLDEQLKKVEWRKNDSNRYYRVMREIHNIIFNSVRIYMALSDQNHGAGLTIIFLYLELFCRNRLM